MSVSPVITRVMNPPVPPGRSAFEPCARGQIAPNATVDGLRRCLYPAANSLSHLCLRHQPQGIRPCLHRRNQELI